MSFSTVNMSSILLGHISGEETGDWVSDGVLKG